MSRSLEVELVELKRRLNDMEAKWVQAFSASNYLRFERFPGLVTAAGGIVVHAGSWEAQLDRFKLEDPDIVVWESINSGDGTFPLTNVTGSSGRLLTIGVVVSKNLGSAGSVDIYLDVIADGQQGSIQFVFADRLFGTSISPWVARTAAGAGVQAGGAKEDALLFPLQFTWKDSLTINVRAENTTGFVASTDEWDLAFRVHRASLV